MDNYHPSTSDDNRRDAIPSIEGGGIDDSTVASPALGYGMERVDFLDTRDDDNGQTWHPQDEGDALTDASSPALGRNEVAAVSVNRSFYVSDVPSPYLSTRQAQESLEKTKRRHSIITTVITLLLVAAALGTGIWFIWQNTRPQTTSAPVQYETAAIERGEFLDTIETTSLVRPADERAVNASVSGTIAEVYVTDNVYVNEGDALFRLDNPTISDALVNAQGALNTARADNDAKRAALDEANAALAAAQAAAQAAPSDAAAQTALVEAQNRVTPAQVEFDASSATLQTIQEAFDRAQEQQDQLIVRSPLSGTVSEFGREVGVGAAVSGSTRLCVVSDNARYRIDMEVPQNELDRVYEGQEVRLRFPSLDGLQIGASVSFFSSNDDIHIATVILDEPDERIAIGMAAESLIILQSIPDSLIVPMEAIRTASDGTTHLDVLLDPSRGIDTDVPVTVVATNGAQAAVEASNIQAGTTVILANPSSDDAEHA